MVTASNTTRDVARVAGVSIATVSRVVNGTGKVSDIRRERVLSAIVQLRIHPDVHAVELRRGRASKSRRRGNYEVPITARMTEATVFSGQRESRSAERLRSLENENAQLRGLVANLTKYLDGEMQRIQVGRVSTGKMDVGSD
jgi:transcriptional regulator with XRE-family HTH domain